MWDVRADCKNIKISVALFIA